MLQPISSTILLLLGWKLEGHDVKKDKYLIIGAPHTTNWDFPLTLLALSGLGIRFSWVAKHTLFKPPLGFFMRAIGGIPVKRGERSGFLTDMISSFDNHEKLILAIAPEGTRSKKDHWKGGFYQIAVKAGVDICLGFIDYKKKRIGIGPFLKPSCNITQDFKIIEEFYQDKRGKYPDNESLIALRDKEIAFLESELCKKLRKSE